MEREVFGGFEALDMLSGALGQGHTSQGTKKSTIKHDPITDPKDILGLEDDSDPVGGQVDKYGNKLDEDGNPIPPTQNAPSNIVDNSEGGSDKIVDPNDVFGNPDPEDPKNTDPKNPKDPVNLEDDIFGDAEPELAAFLQERLFEKFNIPVTDETEAFESMDDITDFVIQAIEENSIPEFANSEVAAIDKYVRNGGRLEDYMGAVHGGIDIANIDLEDEAAQKAIIREDLKNQGLSDARIKRRIERMEDSGILAEEAEDAMEAVNEYRSQQSERLLRDQENARKAQEEANRKYLRNVQSELKNMDEILGVKFTEKAKRDTYNFVLSPDEEGFTPIQRALNGSVKDLLEVAYFLQNKDSLTTSIENKATSKATKKLKDKLANNRKRGRNQVTTSSSNDDSDIWDSFSRRLTGRKF